MPCGYPYPQKVRLSEMFLDQMQWVPVLAGTVLPLTMGHSRPLQLSSPLFWEALQDLAPA